MGLSLGMRIDENGNAVPNPSAQQAVPVQLGEEE